MDIGDQLEELAFAGMEDNLDPDCMGVFKYVQKAAVEMKQMAKAEIRTHISKGKWAKLGFSK